MNIIKEIGAPAMLEQCAEECTELAHACLKLSRKMRDENPTPKTKEECFQNLVEEMADVSLCIKLIVDDTASISPESIESWMMYKESRMKQRLADRKVEELKGE